MAQLSKSIYRQVSEIKAMARGLESDLEKTLPGSEFHRQAFRLMEEVEILAEVLPGMLVDVEDN